MVSLMSITNGRRAGKHPCTMADSNPAHSKQTLQSHSPQAELLFVSAESAEARAWEACCAPVCLEHVEEVLRLRQPELYKEYQVRACQFVHVTSQHFQAAGPLQVGV
jgi:hypothetical protein